MMENFYAYSSVYMLYKFNLLKSCLKFDEGKNEDYIKCVNMMILGNCLKENFWSDFNKNDVKILNYALLTSPFKIYENKIKKNNEIGSKIILSQILKIHNNEVNDIITIINNIIIIKKLINQNKLERLNIGLAFRNIKEKYIKKIIILSICEEYIEKNNQNLIIENLNKEIFDLIVKKYGDFYKFLIDEHLDKINEMKPLLNGKDIKKELNISDGKQIGILLSYLIEEQIKNPKITKDEAIIVLKNIKK